MWQTLKALVILLSFLLTALFFGLGERPVYKIQEVRIAETAREMVESGDWIVPRYNGELRLQKPPLPYWATAVSYRIRGVDELAVRLPAALAGISLALLVWFWARREIGVAAAGNALMVLVASYLGMRYLRSGEADAILLLFICIACKLGFEILCGQRDSFRRLFFGLSLGLGFISKGPAALFIPLLALTLMAISERRLASQRLELKYLLSLPGILAFLISAFGWYFYIFWSMPEIASQFFSKQIDETFISGNHVKPLWWYVVNWAEFFAPWGVLILPAGLSFFVKRNKPIPRLIRFAWAWLSVVFVLLTGTVNKQAQYALLFAPPMALIIGHYLSSAEAGFKRLNQGLFVLFCIAAVAGIFVAIRKTGDVSSVLFSMIFPLILVGLAKLIRTRSLSLPVLFVAGVVSTAYLYAESHLSKDARKTAAQNLMRDTGAYSPLLQLSDKPGNGELSFYAGRVIAPVGSNELTALLARYPAIWLICEKIPEVPNAEVHLVARENELSLVRISSRH